MPTSLSALRARYAQDKAALWAPLLHSDPHALPVIHHLLQQFSDVVDRLLQQLWQRAALPEGMALIAVGGYGRAQLFPHSDIDVLVLLQDSTTSTPAVEAFIRSGWDVGLRMASSVRTVAQSLEEARECLSTQTALLETRLVCGDVALLAHLRHCCAAQLNPQAFVRAKTLEMRQRHMRYENTPYALEPDCKESPGGLRDLQLIVWIARAAGLGHTWRALMDDGLVTALEMRQLETNETFLALIRARLHLVAGREENRLLFELQTAVAACFGWHATSSRRHSSELLMRRYYWAAKAISQLTHIVLLGLQERLSPQAAPLRPLNARFYDKGGLLEVARDDLYQQHPTAILETFVLYQSMGHIKDLSVRTLRALYNARSVMDHRFRRDSANRAAFMHILRQPRRVAHTLHLMNQTSVLGRTFWPFRRIVGRMQHDLFHIYTVDQHSLMVLRNMRRFFLPEHAHEYPLCAQLAADWDKPWLLYLAALLHDIGKGHGGDHSATGAAIARRFCRQHADWGVADDDGQLVEFLVAEHLTLSQVAQKQDLSDPSVIAAFAQRVGSMHRLTALYLLTVADIRGTSPKVWSAWKGTLLETLYRAAARVLGGDTPHLTTDIAARKQQALALLQLLPTAHPLLWNILHVSYFMRHDADEIAWHARHLCEHMDSTCALVHARLSPAGEGLQVLVYARDQAALFARICGWFDQVGCTIVDARIHTTNNGYALDTFQVIPLHHAGTAAALVAQIEAELPRAIDNTTALPRPVRRSLSRRAKHFPVSPNVTLRPDDKGQRWLLHLTANDRSGLLYAIACVLARHHISVELAKISTLGERVEDSFLLQGASLQDSAAQLRLENELLHVLLERP